MGDTPKININKEKTFAISFKGNKSRTIALGAIMATQPPNACTNRNKIKISTDEDRTHPIDASIYNVNPK